MNDAIIRYVCEGIELFRGSMPSICPVHKHFFVGTGLYEAENIESEGSLTTVHCLLVGDSVVTGYPTLAEVEAADHEQLGAWVRVLHTPGRRWFNTAEFYQKVDEEATILKRVNELFQSKSIPA